jgi:hypothetical protein
MEHSQREEVIRQASKIASLRENIASLQIELQRTEAEFDRLLLVAGPSCPPILNAMVMGPSAEREAEKSMNQTIVDLLLLNAPGDMDAEELVAQLPEGTNITSVRSALARLADQNKIRRTTRGRYACAEQVPEVPQRIAS